MAGMRDVLIYKYFGVDLDELWDTVLNDLPELRIQINKSIEHITDKININKKNGRYGA